MLHDGSKSDFHCSGLGLRPGSLERTLREAIDQCAGDVMPPTCRDKETRVPPNGGETVTCPKCGTVMCEKFKYHRGPNDMELAIPTGKFNCMKCGYDPDKGMSTIKTEADHV